MSRGFIPCGLALMRRSVVGALADWQRRGTRNTHTHWKTNMKRTWNMRKRIQQENTGTRQKAHEHIYWNNFKHDKQVLYSILCLLLCKDTCSWKWRVGGRMIGKSRASGPSTTPSSPQQIVAASTLLLVQPQSTCRSHVLSYPHSRATPWKWDILIFGASTFFLFFGK